MAAAAKIKERRLEAARGWEAEARHYRKFADGIAASGRHLFFSSGPLAVAIVTIRHANAMGEASRFWCRAIQNNGLEKGDPARALIETWATKNPKEKSKFTRYQVMHLAALAWNKEFEGKRAERLRLPGNGELYIAGTPY